MSRKGIMLQRNIQKGEYRDRKRYLLSNLRGLVTPVKNVKVNYISYSLPRDYFKDLFGK